MNSSFDHLSVQINLLSSHPRRFSRRILSRKVVSFGPWSTEIPISIAADHDNCSVLFKNI